MSSKNLKLAQYTAWSLAAVSMFFLILGNEKNNLLNAVSFTLIILGIIFSYLSDKKV